MQGQANIIASERTWRKAMKDPEWIALGCGDSDADQLRFGKSIRVEANPGNVTVYFLDRKPGAAQVGVNALVRAYLAIYEDMQNKVGGARMQYLESDRARQQAEYDAAISRVAELSSLAVGVDNLEHRYEWQGKMIEKYATEMEDIQKQLLLAQVKGNPNPIELSAIEALNPPGCLLPVPRRVKSGGFIVLSTLSLSLSFRKVWRISSILRVRGSYIHPVLRKPPLIPSIFSGEERMSG